MQSFYVFLGNSVYICYPSPLFLSLPPPPIPPPPQKNLLREGDTWEFQSTGSILNWNAWVKTSWSSGKNQSWTQPTYASTLGLEPRLNWWEVSALCHPCNPFNISIRYTVFLFLSSFYSYVFWLGDFNYRINETIENIKGLCGKQEYSALWPHDQVFKYILYIYIVMYSVPLPYCGSSTVIKEVDHQSRMA